MIEYIPLKDADLSLVEIKDGKPWCKKHGAMNKLTASGIWRCIASYRHKPMGLHLPPKVIENVCKAGCQEARK